MIEPVQSKATESDGTTAPLGYAAQWLRDGHQVAVATVLKTWGSAPRQPGSQLVIRADGVFEGSVSGGCVEGAVIAEVAEVLETGKPKLLHFGVTNDEAWQVGLACGGEIDVMLEPIGAAAPAG